MQYITNIWNEIVTWCHGGVEPVDPEPEIEDISYGLLYNWYAATDVRGIAAEGWHVPTQTELETLQTYSGGASVAGGKLKEVGTTYWDIPNTGATNELGFNARGSGIRLNVDGIFYELKQRNNFWSITEYDPLPINAYCGILIFNEGIFPVDQGQKSDGYAIRPIKDSTTLTNGQTGTYTGNDGKIYRTICIGTQEWLADNLAETKFRNGDDIPEVTDKVIGLH